MEIFSGKVFNTFFRDQKSSWDDRGNGQYFIEERMENIFQRIEILYLTSSLILCES